MSTPDKNQPWGDDFQSWFNQGGTPEDKDTPPDEQTPPQIPQVQARAEVNYVAGLHILRPKEGTYVICDTKGNEDSVVTVNFKGDKAPGITDNAMLVVVLDHLSTSKDHDVRRASAHLQQAVRWLFLAEARKELQGE